ncbi:N-6 DNA methylase [Methanobrevibacter sp.]|uniref:N-6 DNA methylase n=1 Tax=Methanobrevibacter sp. TaxID=66852 RepID=UPI0025F415FB|nr:N-6 DNA methylase [Methanobrevibacter sp.]MBR4447976.1 N-6 DNA methylase [Methanobrevibacter sp.]
MKDKKSTNYTILKQLMSKSRGVKLPDEMDYIVLYTFLYKYCSDNIKDFLLLELKDKELTIDESYRNPAYQERVSFDALKLYGFYIKRSEAFIDEVVNNNYLKPGFLPDFLKIFPEYSIFSSEYHNLKYFDDLFKTIDNEIDTYEYDEEVTKNVCEIIYLISQLDVFELDLEFSDVFDIISASRLAHVSSNPEFITQILSKLVLSEKQTIESAYDPFMKDGSSIMKLRKEIEYGLSYCYGKDISRLNYLYTIVRFFINNFSFKNVFLKQEDALDSVDINGASFDVILSRIPIAIKNYYSSNINQSREMSKRSKRSELENLLLNNFGIDGDSFKLDSELNSALENLVNKIDVENELNIDFEGQYEILRDSEFLFLLNLIDSLKDDGIMAISISENFLFKNSLEILRKYLTLKKNYIDTIIRIPNEINRSRPEVVIVFRKNRVNKDILFIDMSSDYETKRSDIVYPGLFRKNLILDDTTIEKMENAFVRRLSLPKFSNLISIDEIKNNNFNLSVSRYVDTFEGEFISLDELVMEKQDIDSNIRDLNLKIEKMMDELDIRF